MLKSEGISPPTFFFFFFFFGKNVLAIMILAHNSILPPKIAMTLFNDTDERDDYEIRNGEFVGFLWAVAYTFCVALMVTHLFLCENGFEFWK